MSTPDDEYRALLEDRDEIISDLRAKLQAAECECAALVSQRDALPQTEMALRTDVARLEAQVARLKGTTYNPHPAQLKVLYPDQCRAITEAALAWGWDLPWPTEGMTREQYINRGIEALLGEGE